MEKERSITNCQRNNKWNKPVFSNQAESTNRDGSLVQCAHGDYPWQEFCGVI